jgi:hypothetical protein
VKRSAAILISAGAGFVLLAGGAAAGAAIAGPVDASGVIHACYDSAGRLKVIDASAPSCPKKSTSLNWNQTGPQGPAGAQGSQGPAGAQGAQGLQGLTGPSTAGTAGLDVQVITAEGGGTPGEIASAKAICPADHPYILGGSGSAQDSTGSAVQTIESAPLILPGDEQQSLAENFPGFGTTGGWIASAASGDTAFAEAICAR